LAAAHRGVLRLDRLLAEIAVALFPPGFERVASEDHYAAAPVYRTLADQRAGLHPFEDRALAAWFPPPPARLFVPGAGGGREMLALLDRGYAVDALEPVPILAEAARLALVQRGRGPDAAVLRASLEDWCEAPIGAYDGIFTGWGLWSHLIRREARLSAMRAFREVCPRGPVLLSFWRRERVFDPEERWEAPEERSPLEARVLSVTRGLLRERLLGLPPVEAGAVWRAGLFAHCVSEAELREEAALCGYQVVHYERDGSRYPNAVLTPGARD
jgi:hypothetical protein